jgi:hypothetical protein
LKALLNPRSPIAPHNRDRLVFSRISGKMAGIFVVMNADFNIRLTFFADRDLVVARSLSLKIEIKQTFYQIVSRGISQKI